MDQKAATREHVTVLSRINVGKPVEWMVDPDQREVILGVTYEFSLTGERKTVWYTTNKRRAKRFITVPIYPYSLPAT